MKALCPKCQQTHELAYIYHSNYSKHLILLHLGHTRTGREYRSDIYMPFVENLNIPTMQTKKQIKEVSNMRPHPKEAEVAGQISLLT